MKNTYDDYLKLKIEGKSLEDIVSIARNDHSIIIKTKLNESDYYTDKWIPFNLERIYMDELIDKKEYGKVTELLTRMRHSYTDVEFQNFIESYEYHLRSIIQSEQAIKDSITKAKKEFNQHTITLVSIIVGVITIFGSANTVITNHSWVETFFTFVTIIISVIAVIGIVTLLNVNFPKK